jgi:hypothetical protein
VRCDCAFPVLSLLPVQVVIWLRHIDRWLEKTDWLSGSSAKETKKNELDILGIFQMSKNWANKGKNWVN